MRPPAPVCSNKTLKARVRVWKSWPTQKPRKLRDAAAAGEDRIEFEFEQWPVPAHSPTPFKDRMRRERETDRGRADGPTAIKAMTNVNMSAPATPRRAGCPPLRPRASSPPLRHASVQRWVSAINCVKEGEKEGGRASRASISSFFQGPLLTSPLPLPLHLRFVTHSTAGPCAMVFTMNIFLESTIPHVK